ncbi:hypothetical protein C5167_037747, partial [Papaver somniferum]
MGILLLSSRKICTKVVVDHGNPQSKQESLRPLSGKAENVIPKKFPRKAPVDDWSSLVGNGLTPGIIPRSTPF